MFDLFCLLANLIINIRFVHFQCHDMDLYLSLAKPLFSYGFYILQILYLWKVEMNGLIVLEDEFLESM